ncbi:relaxase/mobilization nuclease domain-containing protein [Longimicrobium sp.]|uniref:relaxase/mobilization nuclease domain-containing protein n=1 Tax=Longimicrobium sp. TaxID=2029185 RepID=UPI003B3A2E70
MIGKPLPFGKGFLGLSRYLVKGAAGEERERVEWVETRNLPTEDPETAARLMAAYARQSVRTQRPVYHLVVSADPGDPVDRASMSRVADTVLRELGLSEHQVLIIAHNDTAHPHMHLVVNRVHPKRPRAWENGWDWPKIEKALSSEEKALGWRVAPRKRRPGPTAPALVPGDPAFLRMVQERGGPVLGRAASWAELEEGFEAVGLHLRIKGGGLSIHDGRQEVKASEVDRSFSRRFMEERLGKLSEYRRSRPVPRVADVVRAPEPELPAPVPQLVRQRGPVPAHAPSRAPASPAPDPVRVRPDGEVPPVAAPPEPPPAPAPGPPPEPDTAPVPARARERFPNTPTPAAAPPDPEERFRARLRAARERDGGVLPEVASAAELACESRAWFAYDAQFNARYLANEQAEEEVKRLERLQGGAAYDAASLSETLARVYTDPESAAERLIACQREHGKARVEEALSNAPEQFGTLRSVYPWWGLGIKYTTAAARQEAQQHVAGALDKVIRAEDARPGAAAVADAKQRARDAQRELDDARAKRNALRVPGVTEERAAELLAPLARSRGVDWVRQELTRLIPPEDREAARIAARILSHAARGLLDRDRSRGRGREIDRGIDH